MLFVYQHSLLVLLIVGLCSGGASAIALEEFYKFGAGSGDSSLPSNDDGSSAPISLSRVFPFYQRDHFSIIVSRFFLAIVNCYIASYTDLAIIISRFHKGNAEYVCESNVTFNAPHMISPTLREGILEVSFLLTVII